MSRFTFQSIEGGLILGSCADTTVAETEITGQVGFYQTDVDGDGQGDSTVTHGTYDIAGVTDISPVAIGIGTQDAQSGFDVTWSAWKTLTIFISLEKYFGTESFKQNFFSNEGHDSDGAPIFKKAGELTCTVKTN